MHPSECLARYIYEHFTTAAEVYPKLTFEDAQFSAIGNVQDEAFSAFRHAANVIDVLRANGFRISYVGEPD